MPVAVVTGASRGLGAALAAQLESRGFALGLCARTMPTVGDALCRSVDIADSVAVERFAAEAADTLGPIDLWVNNAAVLGPIGPLRSGPLDEWRSCVDINLLGVVHGSRALLAYRAHESATLVNIASRAAGSPAAGLTAYSSTKAAVVALTVAIADEEKGSGLRAHVVIPPSFDTEMQETLLRQEEDAFPGVVQSRERKAAGQVLPAAAVANQILDSVLDSSADGSVVVDLLQGRRGAI